MFQNATSPDTFAERYENALATAGVLLNVLALVCLAVITIQSRA
ncbi:MAG: hypothetical protein U0169_17625 [Polyangiaceae bacterium]